MKSLLQIMGICLFANAGCASPASDLNDEKSVLLAVENLGDEWLGISDSERTAWRPDVSKWYFVYERRERKFVRFKVKKSGDFSEIAIVDGRIDKDGSCSHAFENRQKAVALISKLAGWSLEKREQILAESAIEQVFKYPAIPMLTLDAPRANVEIRATGGCGISFLFKE